VVSPFAEQSGEVEVFGGRGVQISVDGSPAQTLPLSAPLSLSAGIHFITATQDRATLSTKITVRAGRALEVRFNFEVQAVSVTIPPHALLLEEYEGVAPELAQELAITTVRAFSKQRLTLLLPTREAEITKDCKAQPSCLIEQAQRHESDYAVVVSVSTHKGNGTDTPSEYQIRGQIIDRSVGSEASSVIDSCSGCSSGQLSVKLRTVFSDLAAKALSRTKGILRIESEPPQAAVYAGSVLLGKTPLTMTMWASTIDLKAVLKDHQPLEKRVVIADNTETRVALKLEPEEKEEIRQRRVIVIGRDVPVRREPRPRWRLIAGGIGIGAGGLLIGFGSGALSIDGQCITPAMGAARHCDQLYSTSAIGTGLVASGAVLAVSAVLLLAWPGKAIPPTPLLTQGITSR